ncbi:hypothetical protein H310_11175 [Aphanomyces invadans]|uniref:Uncharacterized protein n=1 Tax=Aphanomyces invadans TaxID=157072 RepID=A0A024TML7_9STRA|nr:hypothetical protein H310_11175 [Aphanomyces invadans]ETV95273.1 hypothetical protein H310_11175 [Aphanomyces invadans]|eukprot:XP_008875974.1 hypothetical protein H310_11175 [Aphanomyces invadans]
MSYRLIEARFQILDEAVARLERSKSTKLNASARLRGAVRINPQDVATWMKPNRPRSSSCAAAPPSSESTPSTATTSGGDCSAPSYNQTSHDVHLHLRRSTLLSRQAKREIHPLIVRPAPATHDWGHPHQENYQHIQENDVMVDPKEAMVHRAAHDTWEHINQDIHASTGIDVFAATTSPTRHVKAAPAASPPTRQPTSAALATPALPRSPMSARTRRNPADGIDGHDEHSDDEGHAYTGQRTQPGNNNSGLPRHQHRSPTRARGRLVSQSRIVQPPSTPRDWFSRHEPQKTAAACAEMPHSNRRRRDTKLRRQTGTSPSSAPPHPPRGSDDPAYYYLEIRLEHATSLAGWTFRVIVTDTTHPLQPVALFNHMQCDTSNCIVFNKPPPTAAGKKTKNYPASTEPMLRATIFDPMRYFDHVCRPGDLYGHALRIQVVSEWPVQKTIVDTMVHFTDTHNGPTLSAEELLHTLHGNKPQPIVVDDGAPTEAPPSTHDMSEYIYRNHFEAVYGTDTTENSSKTPLPEKVVPDKKPATVPVIHANDMEAKKRELQRIRETMMDDMLREQQRLASFR